MASRISSAFGDDLLDQVEPPRAAVDQLRGREVPRSLQRLDAAHAEALVGPRARCRCPARRWRSSSLSGRVTEAIRRTESRAWTSSKTSEPTPRVALVLPGLSRPRSACRGPLATARRTMAQRIAVSGDIPRPITSSLMRRRETPRRQAASVCVIARASGSGAQKPPRVRTGAAPPAAPLPGPGTDGQCASRPWPISL